jgi:hypothetical protein
LRLSLEADVDDVGVDAEVSRELPELDAPDDIGKDAAKER